MVKFETRTGKWLAAALTASLAINLFLGGLFVGRWLGPSPVMAERGPRGPERPIQAMLNRMGAALDPDDRAVFESAIDRHRPRLAATSAEFREARRRTVEIMASPDFSRGALDTAMNELRERNGEFQRTLHTALVDAAAALPPPARQKLAAASRPRSERERPNSN